jgi:hypothetical protein
MKIKKRAGGRRGASFLISSLSGDGVNGKGRGAAALFLGNSG